MMDLTIPKHIAIVMDGNGRWAKEHNKPRVFGHHAGAKQVRRVVEWAGNVGVKVLSLFAFSSENWRRPPEEVSFLMDLFLQFLKSEVKKLQKNSIRLRIMGDISPFSDKIKEKIVEAEKLTAQCTRMQLVVAVNYGGQWDILQAVKNIAEKIASKTILPEEINEKVFTSCLAFPDLPFPDLFIRTSGEQRISNFFLWQLAYTELYFTEVYWPDFTEDEFKKALETYSHRVRRFGEIDEQIKKDKG